MWHLQCFGGFRAQRGEIIIERFRTQKTGALLALLALCGSRSREEVCLLLWPDALPEAARNSLSAALSALRRDLGGDVLNADRQIISLAPGKVVTDIAAFDAALKQNDFAAAVALYSGHLLLGFHEDPFPALAGAYSEKARGAFLARLKELEQKGDAEALRSLARRAISIFGDDEHWFIALMRAHQMLGDLDAALRAYEGLQRFTRKNGEVVSNEARDLAKRIRRQKEQSLSTRRSDTEQSGQPPVTVEEVDLKSTSFPAQWTRFFGREAEQELLRHWLQNGEKLITLSGTGGSGKTRLSIETIRGLESAWDQVHFVPLAALTDPTLLYTAIRDALGFTAAPDLPPLDQLERKLGGQKILFLLDNFEQLVEGGAFNLQLLRERLPAATFIVTSRVLLNLPGEREFPLAPLPTPLPGTATSALYDYPSAVLFCDRAGTSLEEQDADEIGALCRRLDGIPLAIELAAARAKVLTPSQILQRLEQHPDFLHSRELGVPPRHKTLRATIEWSVDLLAPEVRSFFCRLGVFRGGFTLEAAEKVAAPGICAEWETIELLDQLRSHSLLQTINSPEGTRYRLLEMLREWSVSQLSPEERDEVEKKHLDFYLAQAESCMDGGVLIARQMQMEADMANFRAALALARNNEPSKFAALVCALCSFWELRAHFSEGCGWCRQALEHVDSLTQAEKARLMRGAGTLFWYGGDLSQARDTLEISVELYGQLNDDLGLAHALDMFGKAQMVRGECEGGRGHGERAAALARERGDIGRLASSLITQAWGLTNTNRPLESNTVLQEALAIANTIGEPRLLAICQGSQTLNFWGAGEHEVARRQCVSLLSTCDESANAYARGFAHGVVTLVGCGIDDWETVRPILARVTREHFAIGTRWEFINLFFVAGRFAVRHGEQERAALLFSAAAARCESSGYRLVPCLASFALTQEEHEMLMMSADNKTAWERGKHVSDEEIVSEIEAMCS